MANVKIKPNDDIIPLLLDSDDDVYCVLDLFDTLSFPFRVVTPTQPLFYKNVHKIPHGPLYMKLTRHGSPVPRPTLHLS